MPIQLHGLLPGEIDRSSYCLTCVCWLVSSQGSGPGLRGCRNTEACLNGGRPRESFCQLSWKNDRPPCIEGFLFEGFAHFLAKGGKKTPLESKSDITRPTSRAFPAQVRKLHERLIKRHMPQLFFRRSSALRPKLTGLV